MDTIREILAKNLKENRQRLNISQPKLAELANLSTHYVASIETTRKFPTPDVLEKLAEALGIETHELFSVSHSAQKELENLRNDIIYEVKALNESLAKNITDEVKTTIRQDLLSEINQTVNKAIKQALSEERRTYKQTPYTDSYAAERKR